MSFLIARLYSNHSFLDWQRMLRLRGRHVKTPPSMKRTNEIVSSSLFPCISINGTATDVRRAEWTEYIDPQNAVRTIRGYLKTADSSAHTVNPVQIQRNFAVDPGVPGGRMAETIAAVYSGTGVPPPSVEFLQPSWVGLDALRYRERGPGCPLFQNLFDSSLGSLEFAQKCPGKVRDTLQED